jgi:hypothetical protein
LVHWVEASLRKLGGSAKIVEIAKDIYETHAEELERSGDLFYTWQYDMRWAGLKLSKAGKVYLSNKAGPSRWALVGVSK